MSDGNFNRALLPSTPFASGVKMGRRQMQGHALEVFRTVLDEYFPTLTVEERQQLTDTFRSGLSDYQ